MSLQLYVLPFPELRPNIFSEMSDRRRRDPASSGGSPPEVTEGPLVDDPLRLADVSSLLDRRLADLRADIVSTVLISIGPALRGRDGAPPFGGVADPLPAEEMDVSAPALAAGPVPGGSASSAPAEVSAAASAPGTRLSDGKNNSRRRRGPRRARRGGEALSPRPQRSVRRTGGGSRIRVPSGAVVSLTVRDNEQRERIVILIMRGYGDRERSFRDVRNLFNIEFRADRQQISAATVHKTCQRFRDTGSVKDRPRSDRPKTATNEDSSIEILQSFIEDPNLSTRKASQAHDTSETSIRRVLKNAKFHLYKINLVQELIANDFDRRVEFCKIMMQKIEEHPEFINKIVFSDKTTFLLDGAVNRHNSRYWSDINPHWMRETNSQYPQKLNVWAGIVGTHIIRAILHRWNSNG